MGEGFSGLGEIVIFHVFRTEGWVGVGYNSSSG